MNRYIGQLALFVGCRDTDDETYSSLAGRIGVITSHDRELLSATTPDGLRFSFTERSDEVLIAPPNGEELPRVFDEVRKRGSARNIFDQYEEAMANRDRILNG